MKRVLHIFPPCGRGGTEAVIRFLARELAPHGVESEAYFQRDIGGGCLFDGLCPVTYSRDRSLADVLRHGRFDLIHSVTSSLTMGVADAVEEVGFKGPVVVSCHGDYVAGWNRSNANSVVALTEWWGRKIRPYTDCPVEVIGNPVDLSRFSPPAEPGPKRARPILGWIGHSADPRKNPDRLREIMAALPKDAYDWYIGDTDAHGDASTVFGSMADRVIKYGFLPHAEMPQVFRDIAASGGAVISTSDTEGFPLCILEAMASGCPVIVPDLWGAEEIVDFGRAGLIYRTAVSPHSALACLEDLKQPGRWDTLSRAGRALVERRYSPEAVVGRYLEVFEAAFRAPRVTSPGYRLSWALRSASFYSRPLPPAVSHYRPRRAAEALERALREHQSGHHARVKDDLLEALKVFPVVYLKPWRAKFLLRTLLTSRSHG
jgi:glycosyltransferase involved in cell wall biosynthesis